MITRFGLAAGPTAYRIVVRGHVTDRLSAAFQGMTVEPGVATSVLTGILRDQSQLMGVLRGLDNFGIELISAAPLQEPS